MVVAHLNYFLNFIFAYSSFLSCIIWARKTSLLSLFMVTACNHARNKNVEKTTTPKNEKGHYGCVFSWRNWLGFLFSHWLVYYRESPPSSIYWKLKKKEPRIVFPPCVFSVVLLGWTKSFLRGGDAVLNDNNKSIGTCLFIAPMRSARPLSIIMMKRVEWHKHKSSTIYGVQNNRYTYIYCYLYII